MQKLSNAGIVSLPKFQLTETKRSQKLSPRKCGQLYNPLDNVEASPRSQTNHSLH